MKFVSIITNIHPMKKLLLIVLAVVCLAQFTASGKTNSSDRNKRYEKKVARQEKVKEAVESKSYVIELDRLYMSRYGNINLSSGRNYIIIKGNSAAISAGYMGRQRGLIPVAGIRLNGKPSVYKLHKNEAKGNYRVEMEVTEGSDTFHITMTISENGNCSAIISGAKIDNTRYSGNLVPIEKKKTVPEPDYIKL
ncbi:MAG TPA: hypothetical protein DDY34_00770 [Bacteroidales bacterium]|nr:MAG: hypothetical protein A2X06_00635 [Bacteroidetes bacterium GWC2_40_22]HBH82325.1 hypothetical protein [Bacteroidales bacterium]